MRLLQQDNALNHYNISHLCNYINALPILIPFTGKSVTNDIYIYKYIYIYIYIYIYVGYWILHISCRNYLVEHIPEGKIE
jgi:hypothetical protein